MTDDIERLIEEHRGDTEFMDRITASVAKHRAMLDKLAEYPVGLTPAQRVARVNVARALWRIGNDRIGFREWEQVKDDYLAEGIAAVRAAEPVLRDEWREITKRAVQVAQEDIVAVTVTPLQEELAALRAAFEADDATAKIMLGDRYLDRFEQRANDHNELVALRAKDAERTKFITELADDMRNRPYTFGSLDDGWPERWIAVAQRLREVAG